MENQPRLTGAAALRVLAHPDRMTLLALLREHGPQTASHLAQHVECASGTLSYHLRKLAAAGFIEQLQETRGDGRQRWWRALDESTVWDDVDFSRDPEKLSALRDTIRIAAHHYAEQLETYIGATPDLPEEWVRAGIVTDRRLRLTADQLAQLKSELYELLARWESVSQRNVDGDTGDAVFFLAQGYRAP